MESSRTTVTAHGVPRTASVRERAVRASVWLTASRPLSMALQLVRSLILTRLLVPEAFGLMAMIQVTMQGLQMFSDVGIGPSIVRSKRGDDPDFLCTAWTLQIIRSAALWLICCLLAWPASVFYHEPMLFVLLPVAGVSTLISGFCTTAWKIHDRDMTRGRMTIIALIAEVLTLVVMTALAWWFRSVWALVIGNLCGTLITLAMGNLFLRGIRHRLRWDHSAVRELVHFGKWVFISTILTFFAMQLDKLMLGKLIPLGLLGIYSIALVLSNVPRDLIRPISSLVLFPVLAEGFRDHSEAFAARFLAARSALLAAAMVLSFGVIAIAPPFFSCLYDSRYAEASWVAQLLAVSAWITVANTTTSHALLAIGDSKSVMLGNLANLIVTVIGAIVGFRLMGLGGFIIGYAIGTAAGETIQGLRLRRHGVMVFRQNTSLVAVAVLAGIAYMLTRHVGTFPRNRLGDVCRALVGLGAFSPFAAILLVPVIRRFAPRMSPPWFRSIAERLPVTASARAWLGRIPQLLGAPER